MAFVDELNIHLKAGRGGDGVVRWRKEKGKQLAGASGGNGGKGGDVYARAVLDIGILARYKNKKLFAAENGEAGMKNSMHGKNGDDFYLDIPVGSVITSKVTGEKIQFLKYSEITKLLSGGRGGLGNEFYKSSLNTSPKESTSGASGEEADFFIELQLIADVGLIGLPNAGKSSLLNVLTNADAKVANYAFTTLEPNLGSFYGYIIADIPGLIMGASSGKGLGHKFLRHIKRTKFLVHCISAEEDLKTSYATIRSELKEFDPVLVEKKEILIITKSDMVSKADMDKIMDTAEGLNPDSCRISILDDQAIKSFSDRLVKILRSL